MIADPRTRDHVRRLPIGSCYVVQVPDRRAWNGVPLLLTHPVPVQPHEPPWPPGEPLVDHLVSAGYAVAGSANTIFWPAELAFVTTPPSSTSPGAPSGRPATRGTSSPGSTRSGSWCSSCAASRSRSRRGQPVLERGPGPQADVLASPARRRAGPAYSAFTPPPFFRPSDRREI